MLEWLGTIRHPHRTGAVMSNDNIRSLQGSAYRVSKYRNID